MSAENVRLVRRLYHELLNGRKLQIAEELFAAGNVYHDPANPDVPPGPQGFANLAASYHHAFPDALWTVDELMDAGDAVIARWTGRGTHIAELAGLPPTGKWVEVTGISIFRIAAGKIVETWQVWDALGMFQQLGAVPRLGRRAGQAAG